MRKKKKRLSLFKVLFIIFFSYIVFTLIQQEIEITKLERDKVIKEDLKLKTKKEINNLDMKLSKFEENEVYLYRYIELKEKENDMIKKDNYNEEELNNLRNEILELENILLNSDIIDYIEKIAREDLKMIKQGEIIFIDKSKE